MGWKIADKDARLKRFLEFFFSCLGVDLSLVGLDYQPCLIGRLKRPVRDSWDLIPSAHLRSHVETET